MATAKTGSFYLTETVTIPASSASGTRVQGVVDLGAYVNVATGQAVAIESVDFIYQRGSDFDQAVNGFLAANGAISRNGVSGSRRLKTLSLTGIFPLFASLS